MKKTDPFTFEVIKDILVAIADEMFVSIARTSRSAAIYELLDYSCGIADGRGNTIAESNGVPIFTGVISSVAKASLDIYGRDGLHEGDVIMMNDPLRAGSHLNDITLVMPVFFRGKLVALPVTKCHWMDVGGPNPGSWSTNSTEIFQEGLFIPPVKLYSQGVLNADLLSLIKSNIRIPPEEQAEVAVLKMAQRRIFEVCQKYGLEAFEDAVDRYMRYGASMAMRALQKLPKGTFEAEDHIDDDGLTDKPIPVKVKVTITDNSFTADYTGSAKKRKGPFNCSLLGTTCGARIVFRAITDPHGPVNDGYYEPLHVVAPEGTLFNARSPASFSNYFEPISYAIDLISHALAPHMPEVIPVGGALVPCPTLFAGPGAEMFMEDQIGGWGARKGKDGQNVLCPYIDGDTRLVSTEIIEAKYSVLIERHLLNIADRAGAGKFRGGLGQAKDYRVTDNGINMLSCVMARSRFRPWPGSGGKPGSPNYILLFKKGKAEPQRLARVTGLELGVGDVVRVVMGNGAGWGNPIERDLIAVSQDVAEGYITPTQARTIYGVVVDNNGTINPKETRDLRNKMKAG